MKKIRYIMNYIYNILRKKNIEIEKRLRKKKRIHHWFILNKIINIIIHFLLNLDNIDIEFILKIFNSWFYQLYNFWESNIWIESIQYSLFESNRNCQYNKSFSKSTFQSMKIITISIDRIFIWIESNQRMKRNFINLFLI